MQVLRGVMVRDTVLARIGGDKFAALLPGSTGLTAQLIGQAFASRFAAAALLDPIGPGIEATVSIGVAECGREA